MRCTNKQLRQKRTTCKTKPDYTIRYDVTVHWGFATKLRSHEGLRFIGVTSNGALWQDLQQFNVSSWHSVVQSLTATSKCCVLRDMQQLSQWRN